MPHDRRSKFSEGHCGSAQLGRDREVAAIYSRGWGIRITAETRRGNRMLNAAGNREAINKKRKKKIYDHGRKTRKIRKF